MIVIVGNIITVNGLAVGTVDEYCFPIKEG